MKFSDLTLDVQPSNLRVFIFRARVIARVVIDPHHVVEYVGPEGLQWSRAAFAFIFLFLLGRHCLHLCWAFFRIDGSSREYITSIQQPPSSRHSPLMFFHLYCFVSNPKETT